MTKDNKIIPTPEIFRAIDEKGNLREGSLYWHVVGYYIIDSKTNEKVLVKPSTIIRSTGYKTEAGVEIYEKDCIYFKYTFEIDGVEKSRVFVGIVRWNTETNKFVIKVGGRYERYAHPQATYKKVLEKVKVGSYTLVIDEVELSEVIKNGEVLKHKVV